MPWTGDSCRKCKQRLNVTFSVEPADAWQTAVLNRWRLLCPSCFDVEAEKAGVPYEFTGLAGTSWSQTDAWRPKKRRR